MKWAQKGIRFALAGTMALGSLAFVGLSARQFAARESGPDAATQHTTQDPEAADPLAGLWMRQDPEHPSHLRFYYFHGNGKGLYRYGRRALNQTNSFDYRIRNQRLILTFRKRGVQHETSFRVDADKDGPLLRLAKDPKDPGASYRKMAPPMGEPTQPDASMMAPPKKIGGQMWIHTDRFAKGGGEFGMYQFSAPAMDGRGVGWFHRGDFDDWNTESFAYRVEGDRLEIDFEYQRRKEASRMALVPGPRDSRFMVLHTDPRNYWLQRRYRWMGPSFGGHPAFARWAHMQGWADMALLAR